jgi:itaconate CoA-transferase
MHEEINATFTKLKAAEIVARLEAADIANARLNDMGQFWRHPQLEARGRWAKVGSPSGELDMLKPPFNLSGFEPRMDPVPALGEHTAAILGELGYADAEIEALRRSGAL